MEKKQITLNKSASKSSEICQKTKNLTSCANGRKRIQEVAEERHDENELARIALSKDDFSYHMNNICYKKYTHKEQVKKASKSDHVPDEPQVDDTEENACSSSEKIERKSRINASKSNFSTCVVCGYGKLRRMDVDNCFAYAKSIEQNIFWMPLDSFKMKFLLEHPV